MCKELVPRLRVACVTMTDLMQRQIITLTTQQLQDSMSEEVDHCGDVALLRVIIKHIIFLSTCRTRQFTVAVVFLPEPMALPTLQIPFQ